MNVAPGLLRFVSRFYKRERDPRRAWETWKAFDEERHYDEYHRRCREAFSRVPSPQADADLAQRGFTYLRAMDVEAAGALTATIRGITAATTPPVVGTSAVISDAWTNTEAPMMVPTTSAVACDSPMTRASRLRAGYPGTSSSATCGPSGCCRCPGPPWAA